MFRLTLAQMRRSVGRLVAAGLAIAIGTAFVAATLLAGAVMNRTGRDAVTAQYGEADVVATGTLTTAGLAAVRALPQVAAADVMTNVGVELSTSTDRSFQLMLPQVADPRLTPLRIVEGRAPAAAGEIALPRGAAEAFHVTVGGTLTATWPDTTSTGSAHTSSRTVTLVGIADDPHGAWSQSGGAGIALPADLASWAGATSLLDTHPALLAVASSGTSATALSDEIAAALPGVAVETRDQAAAKQMARAGAGVDTAFVAVVLGFAGIALLVAALVIANTFQVLVAQRSRTLALLRCVGARKRQLRASVLTEAAVLGGVSSLVGLAAGIGLAQGTLSVLRRTSISAPLPASVDITWQVVLVPLLAGLAVTLLASLVPARAATRVTAIEALRPLDAPTVHTGAGVVRLTSALVLGVGGLGLLGGGVALEYHQSGSGTGLLPLAVGLAGGALSFVGLLLGALFWVPPVVRLVERALARFGPVPRLAAANSVRNPRRTAATSTALLIGVTLVVMMSTGAATARASLNGALDQHYPVDITVTPADGTSGGTPQPLPDGLAAKVAGVAGVAHVAALRSADVTVVDANGQKQTVTLRAISTGDAAAVLRDHAAAGWLADGSVLLPAWFAAPASVTVQAAGAGAAGGAVPSLRARLMPGLDTALVTPATMDRIVPAAPPDTLFVAVAPGADPVQVLRDVQSTVDSGRLVVQGMGALRAQYDRVINVLLAVVVGLLGVAVLIALLGVTNTLSLSVLERRRESATLRAIGLTRGRLRGTLAIEGMLIAGVGAVLGIVFGLAYGWAGAATLLGRTGWLTLAVSWRDLALVLVVAVLAGLLASVLPARSAARTPPVAALAEE